MRIDRIKLITEMAKRDMTLNDLVAATGTSRTTISGVKHGRSCSADTAEKIAKALNVPINELLENVV